MAFEQLGVGKEGKSGNRLREYLRLPEMMGKLYIEKKGRSKLNNQVFNCICSMS